MSERGDLEGRFAELRRYDHGRVPSFGAIVGLPRPRWRPAPLLAAALLVLVAGGGVMLRFRGSHAAPTSWLAEWTSPTAVLLQTPGTDFMSKVPSVSESVITLEAQ